MELYNFKEDLSNGVFKLLGRTIAPSFLFSLIFYGLIALLAYLFLQGSIPFLEEVSLYIEKHSSDITLREDVLSMVKDYFWNNLNVFTPLIVSFIILSLAAYNFQYNLSHQEVKNQNNSFSRALSSVVDGRILHYFFIYLILNVPYQLINYFVQEADISIISLAFTFVLGPIFYWMHLSYAAVGIAKMPFINGLKFAFQELSLSRIAKVLGIGIVTSIALSILLAIIFLLTWALTVVPVVAMIFCFAGVVFIFSLIGTFVSSGFSALYFRYSDSALEEEFIVTD